MKIKIHIDGKNLEYENWNREVFDYARDIKVEEKDMSWMGLIFLFSRMLKSLGYDINQDKLKELLVKTSWQTEARYFNGD